MSISKFLGGLITKNPPTPSGPYQDSTAPGIWTLTQVANYIKQGLWPTAGNTNPDVFIENLFSTYLYTGNGSSQTITNGIDLSTKGGLVWFKPRNQAFNHALYDTARGTSGGYGLGLISNSTSAQVTGSGNYLTTFNSNGFTTSANGSTSGDNWVAWTFREQPKFFDVVTYTGNSTNRTIAHNLGSAPGCIIIKPYNNSGRGWVVYHRGLTSASYFLQLETTSAEINGGSGYFQNTAPTSTEFSLGTDPDVNGTGNTYVAYLFAHDAGGFGLTGTDNVISCGSYTGNGSTTGPVITLGYEPQWVMVKRISGGIADWAVFDTMRGMSNTNANLLYPNSSSDEGIGTVGWIIPTATGFQPGWTSSVINASGNNYIYIAIRRGPMKTPTSGTSVFSPQTWSGPGSTTFTSFAPDWATRFFRDATNSTNTLNSARLIGERYLITSSTAAETVDNTILFDKTGGGAAVSYGASGNLVSYYFRRAPGFFDVVCYTGTGSATTFSHNLGVVPQLMIVKRRDTTGNWRVYSANLTSASYFLQLQATSAQARLSDCGLGQRQKNPSPCSTPHQRSRGRVGSNN